MEIKIQSIHFDATEKLQAFIEKKVAKLEKSLYQYFPDWEILHTRVQNLSWSHLRCILRVER